jgi:acyl-CoA dehydrogenase
MNPPDPAPDRLLQQAHALGRDVLARHAAEVDRDARFPRESLEALKQARLLGAGVPREHGGLGLDVVQVSRLCEALGQYCASTAMVYAMHAIQVACVVHHALGSAYFRGYARQLAEEQRLIASATTEVGVGGDVRTSRCALETHAGGFRLTKQAPVISYGQFADDILVTCRRAPDAAPGDQAAVLLRRGDYTAEPVSGWDTLGFRGTCSCGFTLSAQGGGEQVMPTPFAEVMAQTMHPYSHAVWCSLWLGIAADAVNRARAFVRAEARKTPGEVPLSAVRLAETDPLLQEMRQNVQSFTQDYRQLLLDGRPEAFTGFAFGIRTNNLKLACSQRVVDVVGRALLVCGIAGYRNDSKYSLARHLRDAYGAAVMVNNDRIVRNNAALLTVHKEGVG